MADLVIVSRGNKINRVATVEIESDVIGGLVNINADVEIIVFGELNLIEKSLLF